MDVIGVILAFFLLVISIQASIYFLVIKKSKFTEWIFFNSYVPSNSAYLVGFIIYLFTKNNILIYLGVLPMFFFGTLGMFVFAWNKKNIIPQISHILMASNLVWLIIYTFKESSFKSATIGLLLSIFIFAIFISLQQKYVSNNIEKFKKMI